MQLDALEECNDETEMRGALRNIPETLEEHYQKTITRLPKKNRERIRSILLWTTYSFRPLSVEELAEVAGLPFPDDVLAICTGSLVRTSKEQIHFYVDTDGPHSVVASELEIRVCDVVRLAHFSVQEYLSSDTCRDLEAIIGFPFQMEPRTSHREIGERCLSYLLAKDSDSDALQKHNVASPRQTNVLESTHPWMRKDHSLVQYIAAHWYQHVTHSSTVKAEDSKLTSLINDFLSPPLSAYEDWLRLYNPEESSFRVLPKDTQCAPPIYVASLLGLARYVPVLLHQDLNQYCPDTIYKYPLVAASAGGHQTTVAYLLQNGAFVEPTTENGNETALIVASRKGHSLIVEQLLEAGVNITDHKCNFQRAFWEACSCGHSDVVGILLAAGAVIDPLQESQNLTTPLQAACENGHAEVVDKLLEAGANVNRIAGPHQTALQAACFANQGDIINKLLEAGADVNLGITITETWAGGSITWKNYTALYTAAVECDQATVRLLLNAGADVHAVATAIHQGVQCTVLHRGK